MKKIMKVGVAVAAGAAVAFAAGCAANVPAYQCGRVDYKSMASCKGYGYAAPAGYAKRAMPVRTMHKSVMEHERMEHEQGSAGTTSY
jgi:hypothetical protein